MHILEGLSQQLTDLGLRSGDLVMTHASLRKIGEIEGRGETLIRALLKVIGTEGTLVMVLGSPADCVFEAATSPIDPEMGMLAELFRRFPDVIINDHAAARFAAHGPLADELLKDTTLHDYYSHGSVPDKIYQNNGRVLRMGANIDTVTITHFAEYLADIPNKKRVEREYTRKDTGRQVIKSLDDCLGIREWPHGDYFGQITKDFIASGQCQHGLIGNAESELFEARAFIPFAVDWLEREFS